MTGSREPKTLTPVYGYPTDSFVVRLYDGRMTVSHEQFEANGDGDILLELLPSPRVNFRMKVSEFTRLGDIPSWGGVTLSSPVRSCRAYMEKVDLDGSVLLRGSLEDTGLRGEEPLQRLVFHLLNFPTNIADPVDPQQTGAAPGVITLEAGRWQVTLATLDSASDLRFRMTHLGELTRQDGGTFKLDDAWDVLSAIDTFLSFILGNHTSTCLQLTFDPAGVRSDGWDAPAPGSQTDALDGAPLTRGADSLNSLWAGFYRLWSSEGWQEALLDVIFWYVEQIAGSGRTPPWSLGRRPLSCSPG